MISDSKLMASAAWDAQSLNELKAKAGQDPAANIRPVARQVEGMFVQMMLKSMREALPKDGVFSSDQTRLYTSMYDQQIAQQMTAGKGLGLAEMMVKQMTQGQAQPAEETPQVPMKFPLETVTSYQNQQSAGYATDPNYARKLTSMIQQLKSMSEKVSNAYNTNLDNLF